ncbi:hypothetical protein CcCBS67573_g01151 [Chytriomyces confervae]|uniref:P-type Ca(2+) transporter n=1 Tax=Chytriomyces confervae TaxID=246404 RepID=A0A507FMN4_9FUNG|nr:hypothetical protein CcCBS67573_g01151 [Chytriomyces confervae]
MASNESANNPTKDWLAPDSTQRDNFSLAPFDGLNRKLTAHSDISNVDTVSFHSQVDLVKESAVDMDTVPRTASAAFGLTPDEILDMIDPKSPEKLTAFGGVSGIIRRLHSNAENGLSEPFDARTAAFGDNTMPAAVLRSFWDFAKEALKDRTLIILLIAAFAEVAIGIYKSVFAEDKDPLGFIDGLAIIIAVVVIVLISSVNDYRKQSQFQQLNSFSSSLSRVQVTRNGANIQIKTTELLVGDICHITAGDLLPADGLVIQAFNVSTDESAMTGESVTLNKDAVNDPFLFSGTKVVNGVGRMVVIATGRNSMNGRLMAALEAAEPEPTPLQFKLGGLADVIAKFGTYIAVGMFVALAILYGIFHRNDGKSVVKIVNDIINLFIIAITLVVVAVPEGLPLAVTISLAHATLKMLKDNNLVRHLKACETMGNATTICSDKTGTLTQNKMTVVVGVIACRPFGTENLSTNSNDETALIDMFTKRTADKAIKNTVRNADATIQPDTFSGLPDAVLSHIARSMNVNSTAEEVVTDAAEQAAAVAAQTEAISKDKKSRKGDGKPATEFIGSKTEVALLEFTQKLGRGYKQDRDNSQVVEVIPFSSDRKRMSTIIHVPQEQRSGVESVLFAGQTQIAADTNWLFCKGAAELVVNLCDRYVNAEGQVVPMTDAVRAEYEAAIETMASCALRTICVAFKPLSSGPSDSGPQIIVNEETSADASEAASDDSNLILGGIVGIKDPIRPEVPAAVADCIRAGVVVRMVTGDNITTARSIAKNAGILPSTDALPEYAVMDGPTFRKLTPEMMDIVLPQLRVLARSSPLDKQVLVNNLKRLGETVAVTGDGTNDAPALKSADVGFSMGIAGTEMAKEASDIILLDDNFASLTKAIIWGRSVYDSVRKFLQFQLTVNIVAVILTVVSSFLTSIFSEGKIPMSALTAVQLLWVNLIMDTFAALALATDPPTPELLNRPPARKSDSLINYDMWKMIIGQSIFQIAACLGLYCGKVAWIDGGMDVLVEGKGIDHFTDSYTLMGTLVFNTFVFCQLFNEINCRVIGKDLNIFKNVNKNPLFMMIVGGSVVVQVVIVQFGGVVFKTTSLGGMDWLLCIGVALITLPLGAVIRLMPDFFRKQE